MGESSDLLLDAMLRPYSQLMIIAMLVEATLVFFVLKKCLRKDVRLAFALLAGATIAAQGLAIVSDSFRTVDAYSYAATVLVFATPALILCLVFVYLHGRLKHLAKVSLAAVLLASFACSLSLIFPAPAFLDPTTYALGRLLLMFVYVCVAFGGAASELIFEKSPENTLTLMTVFPSLSMWLLFIMGFNSAGALAFSQRTGNDFATSAVMSPLFLMCFIYLPFALSILRTNAIIIKGGRGNDEERKGEKEPEAMIYFVQERRPKYSYFLFKELSRFSPNYLLLTKAQPKRIAEKYMLERSNIVQVSAPEEKGQVIDPRELNRLYATISLFAERNPGSAVMLDTLDYLFTNNDYIDVLAFLLAAAGKARETGCALIIPMSLLAVEERNGLRGIRGKLVEAPELEEELPRIAGETLGPAGGVVLDRVLSNLGVSLKCVEFANLPAVADGFGDIVATLSSAEESGKGWMLWAGSAKSLSEAIMSLGDMPWEAAEKQGK